VLDKYDAQPGAYTFAHWKNVAILVWYVRADGESARKATGFADQLIEKHDRFSVIHVVEETAGLPTSEGRDVLTAVARKNKQHLACAGLLLPRSPILAAMMRTFARSMGTILRGEIEIMIDHDMLALATGLAPVHATRTTVRCTPHDLVNAIEQARRFAAREARAASP